MTFLLDADEIKLTSSMNTQDSRRGLRFLFSVSPPQTRQHVVDGRAQVAQAPYLSHPLHQLRQTRLLVPRWSSHLNCPPLPLCLPLLIICGLQLQLPSLP